MREFSPRTFQLRGRPCECPIAQTYAHPDHQKRCHPERSEGSRRIGAILRYAQDDNI